MNDQNENKVGHQDWQARLYGPIGVRQDYLLGVLRNPHGISPDEMRAARLAAADLIEEKARDYTSTIKWIQGLGIDTTFYVGGRPIESMRAEVIAVRATLARMEADLATTESVAAIDSKPIKDAP